MKRMLLINLLIAGLSLSIGFLSGWNAARKKSPTNGDVWFTLEGDIKTIFENNKNNLASGSSFNVKIRRVEVNACSQLGARRSSGDSPDQLNYLFVCRDSTKPEFTLLNGWLTLRKKDARHVDVVFRPGFLQLGFSDIVICLDDYDIGTINWQR